MNRFHLFVVAIAVVLASAAASAQTSAPVYVPFSFTANHQILPSGLYKVSMLSDRFIAFIDSRSGRTEKVIMSRPETGNRIETLGGLIFISTGHRYVLKEVRMTGSSLHSVLVVQPKPEPQAAKNATDTTFEIAFK
ncbi:MAG TPA: hypothetical protein VLZ50_15400 [Terracidiphilus sp.]|nr:hypothetical protein [Terracidiphilus sp.]